MTGSVDPQHVKPVEAMGARMRGGAATLLAGKLFSGALGTLVRIIVLANLLGPTELGLYGAAMLAIGFLEVFTQSGLRQAIIQTEDTSPITLSTAWTIQAVRGMLLGLILWAASPALAAMVNRPDASLPIAVLALAPMLMGFSSIGVNFLERKLQYGRYVLLTTGMSIVELVVAITYAMYSPTVWALVIGRIAACTFYLIFSFVISQTHARPGFSFSKAKELLSYGMWILVSGLIAYALIKGGDYVVLHYLGPEDYGIWYLAYALATLPIMQVVHTVGVVTFSGFSRLKTDVTRLRTAFLKSFLVIATISFFISMLIIAIAQPFEELCLSDDYAGAGDLIEILAIWGLSRALGAANTSLFQAVGRPALASVFQFVMLVLAAITVIPAATAFGAIGVAWTLAFVGLAVQPMRYPLTCRDLKMPSSNIYLRVGAPLTAAIAGVSAAKILTFFTPNLHPAIHIILTPSAAAISFLAVMSLWLRHTGLELATVLSEILPRPLKKWSPRRAGSS